MPRGHGNSVFLKADFNPHPDQRALFSCGRRMAFSEVENVVRKAERSGDIIGVRRSVTDDEQTELASQLQLQKLNHTETLGGDSTATKDLISAGTKFAFLQRTNADLQARVDELKQKQALTAKSTHSLDWLVEQRRRTRTSAPAPEEH